MWRTEWRLQIASHRNWLMLSFAIVSVVSLTLVLESLARGGVAPFRGFDLLRYNHRIVLRLVLSGLFLTESLHWNCRGFRDGTLGLCFFAELPRRHCFRARLALLALRLVAAWLITVAVSLVLVFSFHLRAYPLLDGSLSATSQTVRFLLASGHDLITAGLWITVGFFLAVVFRGKIFESAFVGWLLFVPAQLLLANGAGGIGGFLGGNVAMLFNKTRLGGPTSAVLLAAYVIPGLLCMSGVAAGHLRFRRMNLFPNWNSR